MKTLVHWWSLKTLVHCHGSESNSHVQRLIKYSVKEIYCHYCDKATHLTAFCLKNKREPIHEKYKDFLHIFDWRLLFQN